MGFIMTCIQYIKTNIIFIRVIIFHIKSFSSPILSCTPAPLHPCSPKPVNQLLFSTLLVSLLLSHHMYHIPLFHTLSLKKFFFKLTVSYHFSTFAQVTMKQTMSLNSHYLYSAIIYCEKLQNARMDFRE